MFADITSANIVGYKAEGLREGFTMVSPSFQGIGKTTAIDLTSLKLNGDYGSGDIVIQTLTALGEGDKAYEFVKDRRGNWFWRDVDSSETIEEGVVAFEYGTGLWVAGIDATSLTSAGQVSTDDCEITLRDGFTATGNMTAVPVDLTAIIPGGEYGSGDIVIQTLTALGEGDKAYEFVKDRRGNWFWRDVDSSETIEEGAVVFAPGAGLWVAGVNGATITIPGPTL